MSHAIWDFITSPYLHFVFVISVLVAIVGLYLRYKEKETEATDTNTFIAAISSVLSNMNEKLETLTKRPDSPITRISILSPQEGETVNLITSVYGEVYPPGTPLQVLVFSRDNLWYPSNYEVKIDNVVWVTQCQLGDAKNPGGPFKIVALLGNTVKKPRPDLPEGITRSRCIHIIRR